MLNIPWFYRWRFRFSYQAKIAKEGIISWDADCKLVLRVSVSCEVHSREENITQRYQDN